MNPKLRAAPLLLAAMLLFVLSSALPAQTRSERTNAEYAAVTVDRSDDGA